MKRITDTILDAKVLSENIDPERGYCSQTAVLPLDFIDDASEGQNETDSPIQWAIMIRWNDDDEIASTTAELTVVGIHPITCELLDHQYGFGIATVNCRNTAAFGERERPDWWDQSWSSGGPRSAREAAIRRRVTETADKICGYDTTEED